MADESVEALLARIQHHLDAKAKPGASAPSVTSAGPGAPRTFSPAVYERLEEADVVMNAISVQPFLTPPYMPIVGQLWQRMRAAAHHLVVFYVNRLAGAQGAFNREILGGLAALVDDLDRGSSNQPSQEISALRMEVQALRSEVASLKAEAAEGTR